MSASHFRLCRLIAALAAAIACVFLMWLSSPIGYAADSYPAFEQQWPPESLPELPSLVLPYDADLEKDHPEKAVHWTGGPHPYNRGGDLDGKYKYGEGSGLDFAAEDGKGFDVLPMAAGTVIESGCGYDGLGCIVAVRHDVGETVLIYAHLDDSKPRAAIGDHVKPGTPLGFAGRSGGQSNVHLHIELRDGQQCNSRWHDQCGDISWAGNPVGWERGLLFVDDYRITGYCVANGTQADANCFEDPSMKFYAYDGAAFKNSRAKTDFNFWYYDTDENNQSKLVQAVAIVDPSFECRARQNCEQQFTGKNMQFAGHGRFGTGGGPMPGAVLESSNVMIASQTPDGSAGSGSRLAFIRDGDIWLLDVSTGIESRLADGVNAAASQLAWSSDGKYIAYSSSGRGNSDIYLVSTDSGLSERITASANDEYLPAFSPQDPNLLYFVETIDPHVQELLMAHDLGTGDEWVVYDPGMGPCDANSLSIADAQNLLYGYWCGTGAGIAQNVSLVYMPDGAADDLGRYYSAASSAQREQACPDQPHGILTAKWAAAAAAAVLIDTEDCFDMMTGEYNGVETIVALDFSGSRVQSSALVTEDGLEDADISPDGQYAAYRTSDGQIWIVDVDSGARQALVNSGSAPAWGPEASPVAQRTATSRPAPSADLPAHEPGPADVAAAYYAELQNGMETGDFRPAYALLSKERQSQRSVESLRDTYSDSRLAVVEQVELLSQEGNTAYVHLIVALTDNSGAVTRYDVIYEMIRESNGWKLHKPEIQELP